MAYQHSGRGQEAETALLHGTELAKNGLPRVESGDLGVDWNDCLIARILLREAGSFVATAVAAPEVRK